MSWLWPFKHSEETSEPASSSSSWIRGISNDTLFIFFFVVFLIALWIHYTRWVVAVGRGVRFHGLIRIDVSATRTFTPRISKMSNYFGNDPNSTEIQRHVQAAPDRTCVPSVSTNRRS